MKKILKTLSAVALLGASQVWAAPQAESESPRDDLALATFTSTHPDRGQFALTFTGEAFDNPLSIVGTMHDTQYHDIKLDAGLSAGVNAVLQRPCGDSQDFSFVMSLDLSRSLRLSPPIELRQFMKLHSLNLSGVGIKSLKAVLPQVKQMDSLRTLNLSHNPLLLLESKVGLPRHLSQLIAQDCYLESTTVFSRYSGRYSLRTPLSIDLRFNQITKLNAKALISFSGSERIVQLDLRDNPVSTIDYFRPQGSKDQSSECSVLLSSGETKLPMMK